MLRFLLWGVAVFVVWSAFSCEEFCEESNRTAVVLKFYSTEDSPAPTVVSIKSIEADSVMFQGASTAQQVLLPINPSAEIMTFSITGGDLPADTITIFYALHAGFISSECGCAAFASIKEEQLEWTKNSFTNVEVTNPNVKTVSYRQNVINAENIRIYY